MSAPLLPSDQPRHPFSAGSVDDVPRWLWLAAAAALAVGVYGRFKGLGNAPLGVDEFYVARSVDNLLRTGLPEFDCGGFYNRGPLFQYLTGLARLAGFSPELAGRLIAALSSLAVLPAVYVLGTRVHGRRVGVLALILVSLSIWEIEMARFGRMYAPFQSIFVWYLVCLLRYIETRDSRSLLAMILLSWLGVLIWEGGVLCGILNFLPPLLRHRDGRLNPQDWKYFAGMLLMLVGLYLAATIDLRTYSAIPAFGERPAVAPVFATQTRSGLAEALRHPLWLSLACVPLLLSLASTRWLWSLRSRWLALAGLAMALVAALAHQLLVCAAILLVLCLTRIVDWRELIAGDSRRFVLALAASATFWSALGIFASAWSEPGAGVVTRIAHTGLELFGFPDAFENIVRPWGRTVPIVCTIVVASMAVLTVDALRSPRPRISGTTLLLLVVVILTLAVSTLTPDRRETRYLFFLYPVLLLLVILASARLTATLPARLVPDAMPALALLCFMIGEDFQPRHLARIDSAEIGFRLHMPPALVDHYYPHNDVRAAGAWLAERVQPGDIVVNGVPSLDAYYTRSDYFFLDEFDNRYEAFACNRGLTERWTNKPIIDSTARLQTQAQSARDTYWIAYPSFARRVLPTLDPQIVQVRKAWSSVEGGIDIFVLRGTPQ